MKLILTTLIFIAGLFISSSGICQNSTEKSDTLSVLLNQSKEANKKLFIVFGWQGCGWCRVYDKYHKDPAVDKILSKYFMITKIDMVKSTTGVKLYESFNKPGTPSWIIFKENGDVLIDSHSEKGNVGFPTKEAELNHYVKALKMAAPSISDSECDLLTSKLKTLGEAKIKEYKERKKKEVKSNK